MIAKVRVGNNWWTIEKKSNKLAGFRVYIMGYQVNLYLGRGGWACLFGMTIAEMTACNLA